MKSAKKYALKVPNVSGIALHQITIYNLVWPSAVHMGTVRTTESISLTVCLRKQVCL